MKILLLLGSYLICNFLFAQEITSKVFAERNDNDPEIVKVGDSYFSLGLDMPKQSGFSANLDRSIHGIEIIKVSSDFSPSKSVKLSGGNRIYGPMTPSLLPVGKKLFLIYYKMISEDNIKMFATEINQTTLETYSENEILNITEKEKYIKFYMREEHMRNMQHYLVKSVRLSGKTTTTSIVQYSSDSSKIMVLWTSGWNNVVFYSVLNRNLSILRTKKIEIPDTKEFYLSNGHVDNAGNVFISLYYEKKGKEKTYLMVSKDDKTDFKELDLAEGDVATVNMISQNKNDNTILLAGTYKGNDDNLIGAYLQEYNISEDRLEKISIAPFETELVKLFSKDGWGSTSKKFYGLNNEINFEIFMNSEEVINLVGEFRKETTNPFPDRNGYNKGAITAGSILIIKFGKDGTSFTRIPKLRNSGASTFGDSYQAINFGKSLIVFYNESKANIEKDINKTAEASGRNAGLVAAIINENGSVKRVIVSDQSDENYFASTDSFLKISDNAFSFLFYKIKTLSISENSRRLIVNLK